jgi:hypothetical protein
MWGSAEAAAPCKAPSSRVLQADARLSGTSRGYISTNPHHIEHLVIIILAEEIGSIRRYAAVGRAPTFLILKPEDTNGRGDIRDVCAT